MAVFAPAASLDVDGFAESVAVPAVSAGVTAGDVEFVAESEGVEEQVELLLPGSVGEPGDDGSELPGGAFVDEAGAVVGVAVDGAPDVGAADDEGDDEGDDGDELLVGPPAGREEVPLGLGCGLLLELDPGPGFGPGPADSGGPGLTGGGTGLPGVVTGRVGALTGGCGMIRPGSPLA